MKLRITETERPHKPKAPETFAEWLEADARRHLQVVKAPDGYRAIYTWRGNIRGRTVERQTRGDIAQAPITAVTLLHRELRALFARGCPRFPERLGVFEFETTIAPGESAEVGGVRFTADKTNTGTLHVGVPSVYANGWRGKDEGAELPKPACPHRETKVVRGYYTDASVCVACDHVVSRVVLDWRACGLCGQTRSEGCLPTCPWK